MTDHIHELLKRTAGRLLAGAVLTVAVGALSACNTTEGAGKDIEAAGEAIQDAAD